MKAAAGWNTVKAADFEREKDRRLAKMRLDSPEAETLVALTWAEVRDDIETLRNIQYGWFAPP